MESGFRFILSPLMKVKQIQMHCNAMNFARRKRKYGITHAKFEKITHEYSTIVGIDSRINI
jgi:hypothetical protein